MKNPNTNSLYRGDIVRVTSVVDGNHAKHIGEDYRLVRTMGARDKNLIGEDVGAMRYVYNLVNTKTGKARVTDVANQFVSRADGIAVGVLRSDLEAHFGMTFRVVTDEPTIAPVVKKAVDAEASKQYQSQNTGALASVLAALMASGLKIQSTQVGGYGQPAFVLSY